jgi:SAM-dependent methyltransferase
LEVRRLDILKDPVEEAAYDLVTARAVLHHIQSPEKAAQRMIAALKPGGWLLCIEPDMLPATATEPEPVRAFWHGWLQWSAAVGIDYFIGRKMPARLSEFGMEAVSAEGCTALYCGGSPWATYWVETIQELQSRLLTSGFVTDELLTAFYDSYNNPQYWTSAITFTASWGRNG